MIGNNWVQLNFINLSYRNRGSVARTHTKIKHNIIYHKIIIIVDFEFIIIITVIILINKILEYSARKRNINDFLLYSMLNPETSSDSPSEKSKGVRLVSAKTVIVQRINRIGIVSEILIYFCKFFKSKKFICSEIFKIAKMINIKLISYEINCATDRVIPINA